MIEIELMDLNRFEIVGADDWKIVCPLLDDRIQGRIFSIVRDL